MVKIKLTKVFWKLILINLDSLVLQTS